GKKGYMLQVNADEYESNGAPVEKEEGQARVTIELEPIEKMIQEEEIVLEPIYFDFDKADIRKQAAFELDKLVSIMKKHPEMEIKVEAHTDKRGPQNYNQQLSERRAKSTVDYVVSQGIDKTRINWEAFGESKPKVECDNCSEEEYQENRRSKFVIIKE
ncbi:OmpA family protein, partial [Haloflavibacter putidus]